jgi:hypothetical protein
MVSTCARDTRPSATKVFQPFKIKLFKGMKGEKGAKARRFVKTIEMYRDSTPGMTEGQCNGWTS